MPKKTVALTEEQLKILIDNFQYQSYHCYANWLLIVRFLVLTGYRFGEMAGLRWSDIDWNQNIIHLQRTLHTHDSGGKEPYFTTPKTKNSIRNTPISQQIKDILLESKNLQMQWSREYPQAWESQRPIDKDLVFTTRYGSHMKNSSFNDVLRRVIPRVNQNLPEEQQLPQITAHSFRDTFASLCYSSAVPLKEVQELMGHQEESMTLYYTQVSQKTLNNRVQEFHDTLDI